MNEEIDLEKPIFVYYIDIEGKGRTRAEELLGDFMNAISIPNITQWIMPAKETKVELLWKGKSIEELRAKNDLSDITNKLVRISKLVDEKKFGDIKAIVRDIKIDTLLEE